MDHLLLQMQPLEFAALPVAEIKKCASVKLCNCATGFFKLEANNIVWSEKSVWQIDSMWEIPSAQMWPLEFAALLVTEIKSMQLRNCATLQQVFVKCRPIILSVLKSLSSSSMACCGSPICTAAAIRSLLHTSSQTLKACNCKTSAAKFRWLHLRRQVICGRPAIHWTNFSDQMILLVCDSNWPGVQLHSFALACFLVAVTGSVGKFQWLHPRRWVIPGWPSFHWTHFSDQTVLLVCESKRPGAQLHSFAVAHFQVLWQGVQENSNGHIWADGGSPACYSSTGEISQIRQYLSACNS